MPILMSRSRASAKAAGTRTETMIVNYLATHIDDRIERRRQTGAKDRGDISGLRVHGKRVVVEVKDTARPALGTWIGEAETERTNDDAVAAVVAFKRTGKGRPADQLVLMTLADFCALVTGERPADSVCLVIEGGTGG